MKDIGHIVAVKRNPIYDDPDYRLKCMQDVIADAWKYMLYDYDGIEEFVFRWMADKKEDFYCSELLNHYAIKHSNKSLRIDGKLNDDVPPYEIQRNKRLIDVKKTSDFYPLREMDYVLTTSKSPIAVAIKLRTAGIDDMLNQKVASHAAIVVKMDGRFWLVEMLADGSMISSINKYKIL